jgi:hypothetical protein
MRLGALLSEDGSEAELASGTVCVFKTLHDG